jgi:ParB family chromosome partitioning protein
VKDAIEQLQRILGLKVQIKDRKGRGRVIIDYANLDDFDRLLSQLLK